MKIKTKHYNNEHSYENSPLRRVKRNHKCEICGKLDWCNYSEDGVFALCMRVSAGSIKQAKNGAYVHVLTPSYRGFRDSSIPSTPLEVGGTEESEPLVVASADQKHAAYSFLLGECLSLSHAHRERLLNYRCLSETTIERNLYASLPGMAKAQEIAAAMQQRFGDDLRGVPGFYQDNADRWVIRPLNGLVIPVRDSQRRIVALQVRPDLSGKNKYLWLSTPPDEYTGGASSGAPVHFANPDLARESGFAVITEGALKADVISELSGCAAFGIAGVNTFDEETFGSELKDALPELKRVAIAFDSDWRANKAVRGGLKRLIRALEQTELTLLILNWDARHGKGLDDFLKGATERQVA